MDDQRKAQEQRNAANNAENIRNAADVAIASKVPHAVAAGAAEKLSSAFLTLETLVFRKPTVFAPFTIHEGKENKVTKTVPTKRRPKNFTFFSPQIKQLR